MRGRTIRIGVGLAPPRVWSPFYDTAGPQDNFDDNSLDGTKWTSGNFIDPAASSTGVTVSETNQRTEVSGPASTAAVRYSGRISASSFDITDLAIFVRIANVGSLQGSELAYVALGADVSNHHDIVITSDHIDFRKVVGGSAVTLAQYFYSGSTPAWFRLRHYSPTDSIKLDTAFSSANDPPIASEWLERASGARDATSAPLTACFAAFGGGLFGSVATPTVIQFDGFNTATSAGQGAVAGSSSLTLSPSATLLGAGSVSGSSSILITPSGTVAGQGAVAGSSTIVLSPSATLLGSGAVSGSSSILLSPSATLLGQGAISGSAALTLAGSGAISGTGQLLGSTALSFSLSGSLGQTGGIQGAAGISFDASAALLGTGQINGSASFSLTLAGVLVAGGAAAGRVKVWNGAANEPKPVKVWDGTAWVAKPLKRWTGTAWQATSY